MVWFSQFMPSDCMPLRPLRWLAPTQSTNAPPFRPQSTREKDTECQHYGATCSEGEEKKEVLLKLSSMMAGRASYCSYHCAATSAVWQSLVDGPCWNPWQRCSNGHSLLQLCPMPEHEHVGSVFPHTSSGTLVFLCNL